MAKTQDAKVTPVPSGPGNSKVLQPNHNLHLARKMGVVKCRVDLYKIPPECINFEPTKTHFYLDTFKFSKKYKLEVPYPEGVQVKINDIEGNFDRGVFTCDLPISSDPNKPAGLDDVVEAREKVVEMRSKGIPVPNDLWEAAQMAKVKEKPTASTPEKEGAKKGKKTPLSNKEKRQKEKAKRALEEADPTDPSPKKKAKKATSEPKTKKSFLDNASDALDMVDAVNDAQEKAIQEKMDKEYAKLSVDTRKRIERDEQKAELRAHRKREAEKAEEAMPKKEKFKKKTSKVSFAKDE